MKRAAGVAVVMVLGLACAVGACSRSDEAGQQSSPQTASEEQAHVEAGIAAAESDDPKRWAPSREARERAKKNAAAAAIALADDGTSEIALGQMERPPVPPPPPKLRSGTEADQFGLPAWEQIARGDLRPKRIQY